jgi:CheY-like chemotaxis protein
LDFAEFFAETAREMVTVTWNRGLLFLFDYRGPFVEVDADGLAVRSAMERVQRGAVELLDEGFIFLTGQVEWDERGTAEIGISIAGTGDRASVERIDRCLQGLGLSEHPHDPFAPEGTRVASGICPFTGSTVSFAANRTDGILFALDMSVPAVMLDNSPPPNADGARAWLIGDTPGGFQSLLRRLQRLGWATSTFLSAQQAREQLAQMKPGMARPSLIVCTESRQGEADGLEALREQLPTRTQVILATSLDGLDQPAPAGVERFAWPFSPRELYDITRRARGVSSPFSGETEPAPLSFRDRPQAVVVDDNAVNLLVASGLLQAAGFEVRTASDGEQAIELCRAQAPQLVLMDVHMPGMDGLQTTRRLRALQRAGSLERFCIVAATADAAAIGRPACLDAGMDGYLSKPLSLQAIESEVDRLMPGIRRPLAAH